MNFSELLGKSAKSAEPFMKTTAWMGLVGHPLFYVIWHHIFPQPYESLAVRLLASAFCLPLILLPRWPQKLRHWLPLYWHLSVLMVLPFPFVFLTVMNDYTVLWTMSVVAATFLLTFFMHWTLSTGIFILGCLLAYAAAAAAGVAHGPASTPYEVFVVYGFTLVVGGVINRQLQKARDTEAQLVRRLRLLAGQNAELLRDRNELLGRFLNNTVIDRLQRFERTFGLEEALWRMTRHERRFCAMMQADIRSFSQLFAGTSELQVAQLVSQCFSEITAIGQDLAVIKPVGDCIFLYSDLDQSREDAAMNVFALACVFVQSVERVNRNLARAYGAELNFGIALHAGEVVYGNLASEHLIDPTVMGTAVNLTARLEEFTKHPVVKQSVGANGVLMSAEMTDLLRKAGLDMRGLVEMNLKDTVARVRDFPDVAQVCAFTRDDVLARVSEAQSRIRTARTLRLQQQTPSGRNKHLNVEYYYEMSGFGANTVWSIFVDVSRWKADRVMPVVKARFGHLKVSVSPGEERWLALSTADQPGQYDETDVGAWALELIEALVALEDAEADFEDTWVFSRF